MSYLNLPEPPLPYEQNAMEIVLTSKSFREEWENARKALLSSSWQMLNSRIANIWFIFDLHSLEVPKRISFNICAEVGFLLKIILVPAVSGVAQSLLMPQRCCDQPGVAGG